MHAPVTKWLGNLNTQEEIHPTVCEGNEAELMQAWDDVTGKELDAEKVALARQEEVEYIHKTNLYTKVPRSKAKSQGAKVITVRWIDINKGDVLNPKYRSRLVAREIKKDLRTDMLAATPPNRSYEDALISVGFEQPRRKADGERCLTRILLRTCQKNSLRGIGS